MRKKAKKSVLTWRSLPLSKVVEVNPRETLPPKDLDDMDVPFYEMAAIDEFAGRLREPTMVPLDKCRSGRTKFRNGDVLFAKITPCVQNGKSALVNGIKGDLGFGSSEFYVLRPSAKILSEYLFYFVRQRRVVQAAVDSFSGTSGRQRVPSSFWESLEIPIPPLPVQEQIVEILQKAYDIRLKRREALELTDRILPSLFIEMFGDPLTNKNRWPKEPIGKVVHFDTAQIRPEAGTIYNYIAPEHIESHSGNYSGPHPVDGRELGSSKHPFTKEHVLYCKLRPYLNKVILPDSDGICSTELVPLRPGPRLLREFLAIYLRLPFFVSQAVQKSQGTKMPRFGPDLMKQEEMIIPPIPAQKSFCVQVNQLLEASQRLKEGLDVADSTFRSLLSRAFTGKLTAEWEAANAEWIAEQVELHEQLPRLILLAFLRERANRAGRKAKEAAILVTALMKYAFLLQMEGNGRRRLYQFVPYHYGPFAKDLYADLEKLQEDGLVTVDNDADEDKTRIILADSAKADDALAVLPDDLKEDISVILNTYGDLDHNALLKTVYEKYPVYAKKSRIRKARKASSAGKKRGRRPRK